MSEENLVLPFRCLKLGNNEVARPSDKGFDISNQRLRVSKVREPIGSRRSSRFNGPRRVPELTQCWNERGQTTHHVMLMVLYPARPLVLNHSNFVDG